MNKFRILGVIAIIAIIANFFGGLDENWRDFKKGFEDGHNSAMEIYEPGRHIIPHHATSVKLNVEPLPETTVDSLSNNRVDWTLPYTVTEIETYAKPSAWHILVMGLAIPGIFLFLIGFCSLIRCSFPSHAAKYLHLPMYGASVGLHTPVQAWKSS